MPRAATTSDVFNAIAEPRRRRIVDFLADRPFAQVNDLVDSMRLPQPTVSKHLGVLRAVGVVSMRKDGQRRLYQLNAMKLKPVYDWISQYDRFWSNQLDRIKQRAEQRARAAQTKPSKEN